MKGTKTEVIRWEKVNFQYPAASNISLNNINLSICERELVLLTGPTGCGKSTLLKTVNGLIPRESAGNLEGSIYLFGQNTETIPSPLLRSQTALLFQNPDDQLLCTRVQEEVAFGPENLGETPDLIASRVKSALSCTGIKEKRFARCGELSGGEKQRVALAGILSLGAHLLALDEPTSQLDGSGANLILHSLNELRTRLGVTIIIAEHRIDRIMPVADRLVIMDHGAVRGDFRKDRFSEAHLILQELGCETPSWTQMASLPRIHQFDWKEAGIRKQKITGQLRKFKEKNIPPKGDKKTPLLQVRNLTYAYPGAQLPALDSISCEVNEGEILALMGRNGSGKTTLLSVLSGLFPLQKGSLEWLGQNGNSALPAGFVGFLFQNPDLMICMETVSDELALGARLLRLDPDRARTGIAMSMDLLRLENLKYRNPFSLSRGERLRVALGALLAFEPQVLLLDEPTAGLDRGTRVRFLNDLRKWVNGKMARAVVLCTHDTDAALHFANKCLILQRGKIVASGAATELLCGPGNEFLPEIGITPKERIVQDHSMKGDFFEEIPSDN